MAAEDLDSVNMHYAKTHLSKLVARVESGEQIMITRAGQPAAKLVPVQAQEPKKLGPRKLGGWEGKMKMPSEAEWAQFKAEIADAVEESEIFPSGDNLWTGD